MPTTPERCAARCVNALVKFPGSLPRDFAAISGPTSADRRRPVGASVLSGPCGRSRPAPCLQAPRLGDIFGDNGMISAVICRQIGQSWEVDTWIMSCRVLGRRVEEALLQYLVQQARLRGITEIIGRYIPTARNGLVRDHYGRLGFAQTGSQNGETIWQLAVSGYCEKNLPLKVDPQRDWKLASTGRSLKP